MSAADKPGAAARLLLGPAKDHLWLLFARVRELQALQECKRPVTVHWQATEQEFGECARALVAATPPGDLWKVITLLAMDAACEFGVNLEDGSYDEE